MEINLYSPVIFLPEYIAANGPAAIADLFSGAPAGAQLPLFQGGPSTRVSQEHFFYFSLLLLNKDAYR